MNNTLLELLVTTLIGSIITINGVAMHSEDIVNSAKSATNSANVHQLATVLELYYNDHQSYPLAHNGTELVDELETGNYIKTRPLDASVFVYSSKDNGQDYTLTVR